MIKNNTYQQTIPHLAPRHISHPPHDASHQVTDLAVKRDKLGPATNTYSEFPTGEWGVPDNNSGPILTSIPTIRNNRVVSAVTRLRVPPAAADILIIA